MILNEAQLNEIESQVIEIDRIQRSLDETNEFDAYHLQILAVELDGLVKKLENSLYSRQKRYLTLIKGGRQD